VAALWPAVLSSVRTGDFFRQDDTRTLAQRFLEANAPPGATVLVQPYSVPLAQSRASLVEALTYHLGDAARASTKFALRLKVDPCPHPPTGRCFSATAASTSTRSTSATARYRDRMPWRACGSAACTSSGETVQYAGSGDRPSAFGFAPRRTDDRLVSPYRPSSDRAVRDAVAPFLHNTDTPIAWALERPGPVMEVWAIAQAQGEPMRKD